MTLIDHKSNIIFLLITLFNMRDDEERFKNVLWGRF